MCAITDLYCNLGWIVFTLFFVGLAVTLFWALSRATMEITTHTTHIEKGKDE